jgi:hypothetical protein
MISITKWGQTTHVGKANGTSMYIDVISPAVIIAVTFYVSGSAIIMEGRNGI